MKGLTKAHLLILKHISQNVQNKNLNGYKLIFDADDSEIKLAVDVCDKDFDDIPKKICKYDLN